MEQIGTIECEACFGSHKAARDHEGNIVVLDTCPGRIKGTMGSGAKGSLRTSLRSCEGALDAASIRAEAGQWDQARGHLDEVIRLANHAHVLIREHGR